MIFLKILIYRLRICYYILTLYFREKLVNMKAHVIRIEKSTHHLTIWTTNQTSQLWICSFAIAITVRLHYICLAPSIMETVPPKMNACLTRLHTKSNVYDLAFFKSNLRWWIFTTFLLFCFKDKKLLFFTFFFLLT